MFLWTKPIGLRTFRQSEEKARASAPLAANQGLYNGFLAAGLFGARTVSPRILVVQAVPAALALLLVLLARGRGEALGPVDFHRAMRQCPAVDGHGAVRR